MILPPSFLVEGVEGNRVEVRGQREYILTPGCTGKVDFFFFFELDPYIGLPPYDCIFFQEVKLSKIFSII